MKTKRDFKSNEIKMKCGKMKENKKPEKVDIMGHHWLMMVFEFWSKEKAAADFVQTVVNKELTQKSLNFCSGCGQTLKEVISVRRYCHGKKVLVDYKMSSSMPSTSFLL